MLSNLKKWNKTWMHRCIGSLFFSCVLFQERTNEHFYMTIKTIISIIFKATSKSNSLKIEILYPQLKLNPFQMLISHTLFDNFSYHSTLSNELNESFRITNNICLPSEMWTRTVQIFFRRRFFFYLLSLCKKMSYR